MLSSLVQVLRGLGFLVFMIPVSAGSCTLWEGGGGCCSSPLAPLHVVLRRRSSECGF